MSFNVKLFIYAFMARFMFSASLQLAMCRLWMQKYQVGLHPYAICWYLWKYIVNKTLLKVTKDMKTVVSTNNDKTLLKVT